MYTTALYLLTSMALGGLQASATVFSESDAEMTFYYDVSESTESSEACGSSSGDPVVADWATTSGINDGIPYCEMSRGYSLSDIGTNRIVAFNNELVIADPAKYCGREVQIYFANGSAFDFSEGSLYIWDGCAACSTADSAILDLSAPAFVEINGGTCSGTNPTGLSYEVLDTYIVDPSDGLGSSYSEESSGDSTSDAGTTTTSATVTTTTDAISIGVSASLSLGVIFNADYVATTSVFSEVDAAVSTATSSVATVESSIESAESESATSEYSTSESAAAETADSIADTSDDETSATSTTSSSIATSTSTSSSCTYGDWQCDGLELQICNYETVDSLVWETIETCSSSCAITDSGSVDCE